MRSPYLDGSVQPEPERITLHAGDLTMVFEAGMLRYIRAGEHEIVRAIYAAVRDHNWGTVPAILRDVRIDKRDDSFDVHFISDHCQGDIHYVWYGTIRGMRDSSVTFSFDGEAQSAFKRNRIGFCVLHPAAAAGAPLMVEHTDGTIERGAFPDAIMPHQPYFDIRALTHQVAPGIRAEVRMTGDSFEMEDQRNWTDASFKTYCTPLAQPFPVQVGPGERVQQSVSVRLLAERPVVSVVERAPEMRLDLTTTHPLPSIGFCRASHGEPLSERQVERLRALRPAHLRIDVPLDADDLDHVLTAVWAEAQLIGAARLEIAALVNARADIHHQIARLDGLLLQHAIAADVIVLQTDALVTSEAVITEALAIFGDREPSIRIGAGTRGFFTQINRHPPTPRPPLVAYALNPQVHAFDNSSLVETLPILGETVRTARSSTHTAIAVTPITFKIAWNPDATAEEIPTAPGELPRRVDPRQMSLFGAGWTLGAVASLALARAGSLTFYETTGWLGVMEREDGAPLPQHFRSVPGGVYPMYHVFSAIAEMGAAAQVAALTSSHPLITSGLALLSGRRLRLLIANHSAERQRIAIEGVEGAFTLRVLDEFNVEAAMRDPEGFRASSGDLLSASGGLSLDLPPYAVMWLDQGS